MLSGLLPTQTGCSRSTDQPDTPCARTREPMPGELEHWSTVLLARKSKLATVADRLRPVAARIPVPPRGFLGRFTGQRSLRLMAQGGALLGVVAGTVAFTSFDKAVTLTVDGHTSSVHAFGSSVGDILSDKGIKVGPHDLVSPAPSAAAHDGQHLVVRYGRQLTVNIDGLPRTYWTTALTVRDALLQLGLRDQDAALSVSRDAVLGRSGLSMTLTTPKDVAITVDGRTIEQTTTGGQRRRTAPAARHHAGGRRHGLGAALVGARAGPDPGGHPDPDQDRDGPREDRDAGVVGQGLVDEQGRDQDHHQGPGRHRAQ